MRNRGKVFVASKLFARWHVSADGIRGPTVAAIRGHDGSAALRSA